MDGSVLGDTPAGSLLKVLAHKTSAKGDLVICMIMLNGKKLPKAIIRKQDTALHSGAIADTTANERSLRIRHAQLRASVTTRKAQLRDAASDNNPHKAEYVKASSAYRQFARQTNALLKEYKEATGPRRVELADELRACKADRARITETYQAAKQKYAAWKPQAPVAELDLNNDPVLLRLRQELAKLEQQLTAP